MIYVQILLILFVYNVRKQNPAGGGSEAFANGGGRDARMVSPRNLCAPHKTEDTILFVLPEDSFVHRESYRLLHFDENKR